MKNTAWLEEIINIKPKWKWMSLENNLKMNNGFIMHFKAHNTVDWICMIKKLSRNYEWKICQILFSKKLFYSLASEGSSTMTNIKNQHWVWINKKLLAWSRRVTFSSAAINSEPHSHHPIGKNLENTFTSSFE